MSQRSIIRAAQRFAQPSRSTRLQQAPFLSPITTSTRATPTSSLRWYSDAAKSETKAEESASESQPEDATKTELEAKKKELTEVTDRYKRSVAEYRNLQEQTRREVQAARDFAIQKFAKDLIESIDNLDRALTTVPKEKLNAETNKDLTDLHGGLKMTERILLDTVKKHGLVKVDPSEAGEKFDPNRHEAMFQAPQPGKEDGTVFFTQQKGFTLNGRVLRAAKVGVVKNS